MERHITRIINNVATCFLGGAKSLYNENINIMHCRSINGIVMSSNSALIIVELMR